MTSIRCLARAGANSNSLRLLLAGGLAAFSAAAAADPQGDSQAAPAAAAAPKETVTEELIRMLAKHNALSKADAAELIQRLQAEQAAAAQPAPAAAATPAAAAPAATAATATAAAPAAQVTEDKGHVHVIYVPESEKQKLKEEVKQDVLATAKSENWAQPNAFPDWVRNVTLFGDFRLRQQYNFFDSQNEPAIEYQAINAGAPYNIVSGAGEVGPPVLDTTVNRQYTQVSLHLGLAAKIADDLTLNIRTATGNITNPVSTNQTLGTDFAKYSFVVDRAYLDYHPLNDLRFYGGRMPNPWLSTSMVWYNDLGFDGVAALYRHSFGTTVTPFITAGAFPIENTALDFPQTDVAKTGSRDKYLFAAQIGEEWQALPDLMTKGAVALYDFYHIDGVTSDPCTAPSASFSCDTDDSRPEFMQKGNTLFAIRNLSLTQNTDPQYQYFGLASPFRVLDGVIALDYHLQGPLHLNFDADYANNLAYKRKSVLAKQPFNNFGDCTVVAPATTCTSVYQGGNQALLVQARIGYPKISERWDWNVSGGYRRIETDAVVDAFNDADFYLGGTDVKGFHLIGTLGFTHNSYVSARWFSGSEITGPRLSIDVLQLDLGSRF